MGHYGSLNLKGNEWRDTYTVIINLFLEHNPSFLEVKALSDTLNRKYLKKTIMTVNYNAGKNRCLQDFIQALKDDGIYDTSSELRYSEFMSSFHKFLTNDLFILFYKSSKSEFLDTNSSKLQLSDATINLTYQDTTEIKEVIKIQNERWIFNRKALQIAPCKRKTTIALNANIIQAYDAELARFLVKSCNI